MENHPEDLFMFANSLGRHQAVTRTNVLSEFQREEIDKDFENEDCSSDLLGEAGALIEIERFVNWVTRTSIPAFLIDWNSVGCPRVTETHIGRRLRDVLPLYNKFSPDYIYCEKATAFIHAGLLISNVYRRDVARLPLPPIPLGPMEAEMLNDLIARIRMSANDPWYMRAPGDRSWEARQRAKTIAEYTADILRYYARTMVVRVDLSYLRKARTTLTIDDVYAHLDQLRDRINRGDPVFECLVGYAWAIEHGERDGYHLHCIFFFDGSKESRDEFKGFEIGDLWKYDITGGKGHYDNCNAHKERYTRLGIGMIHRENAEECFNAIEVAQYLTKDDGQHLRIKPYARRAFGTGQAPDITCKRGRPAAKPSWSWPPSGAVSGQLG